MVRKNGVSEFIGKLLSRKSGGSAHSTQQCKSVEKQETRTQPYMAESCGGCDDHDAEVIGLPSMRFVGGLN